MSGDEGTPTGQPQPSSPPGQQQGSAAVLRLRGLPFVATEDDVREFFRDFVLDEAYICRRNGRSTGEAYVVLAPPAAQQALEQLNKQYMGRRYIELFQSSLQDLEAYKALASDARLRGHVVRLRGLPFSATAADVVQFFTGITIRGGEEGVVLTYTADGRPTGEAYVELMDEEGRKLAMGRHKELMGSRYIETFISSKHDMLQALQHSRLHLSHAAAMRPSWAGAPAGAQLMMVGGDPSGMLPGGGLMAPGQMAGGQMPGAAYPQGGPDALADAFRGFGLAQLPPMQAMQAMSQMVPPPQHRGGAPPGGFPSGSFYQGPPPPAPSEQQGMGGGDPMPPSSGAFGGGGGRGAGGGGVPGAGPQGGGGGGMAQVPAGLQQPMMMQGGYMMLPAAMHQGSVWQAMPAMGLHQPRVWYAPGGANRPAAEWPQYAYEQGGGSGGGGMGGGERGGRHDGGPT